MRKIPWLCLLVIPSLLLPPASGMCPPPVAPTLLPPHGRGPTNDRAYLPRYQVSDSGVLWSNFRDESLLAIPAAEDTLAASERAPDRLEDLLALLGYEGDFSPLSRELAFRRLRRLPKIQDRLASVLGDPQASAPTRAWAAYALSELGSADAVPALARHLGPAEDPDLRGFSALALSRIGTAEALKVLRPLAMDKKGDKDLRCLIALGLAPSEQPEARRILVDMARDDVQDRDLSPRRAAAIALGVHPAHGEVDLLIRLCDDKDDAVRSAALVGLGLTGNEEAGKRKYLKTQVVPATRAYAALAAGLVRAEEAVPDLCERLDKDPEAMVQACAALALGRIASPAAVQALLPAVRGERFASCYAAIALGISKRREDALQPLLHGLESRNRDVAVSSAIGLAILGDPAAAKDLVQAVEKPRGASDLPEFALVSLATLRRPEDLALILSSLRSESAGMRQAAALSCAVFGSPKACPDLEKGLSDPAPAARWAASLGFDFLTREDNRPLASAKELGSSVADRSRTRCLGPVEVRRQMNRYFPKDYKLPITP